DLEDIEEEVEHITDNEVVMSEQKESNHGYTQNIQHFKEKDDIDEWQFEASTASVIDEVSFISSNEVDRADDDTPNTAPCRLTKELSPGSFILPFNINSC
ncbi:hypothetical protein Tco_0857490, partial [Tanacetum coccineum]